MEGSINTVTQKHWYKKWWGILIIGVLLILGSLFTASIFYVVAQIKEIKNNPQPNTADSGLIFQDTEGTGSYSLGASRPAITIVEFADYSCTYSKNSYQTIKSLLGKYGNKVKLVYRDFPYISESSLDLAEAARCAGEQGLFWQMHDKLYENQGITEKKDIAGLAVAAGVNQEKFLLCMENEQTLIAVKKDLAAADKFGVSGTPTWFVNGHKVAGDLPMETWEKIIEQLSK
jgi:protein-disulfide isomerase